MFQDGQIKGDRAMARRQAVSTSTVTTTITESSSSHSSTLSSTQTNSTPHPLPSDSPEVHVYTGFDIHSESYCTVALPAHGIITFNDSFAITLDESLSFATPYANDSIFCANSSTSGNSTVIGSDIPFYASNLPQVYALATATVLSYLLVVILFITPRTFYVGGPSGSNASNGGVASGLLGRGITFMGAGAANSSVIGVGRRPLLQKIAAITVAISLTIATADTFTVAQRQYHQGYMNSRELVNLVVGSNEIRVTRVISDAFLWLAQVQTLIRLFPRHKEKVTIKWLGFGLVICDTVFSILENFVSENRRARPETFTDAIPALSYLFEMAISLIYASCVVYYSLSKRRFAFWNQKMKSMCIMALLGLSAVLIPVVFFIVDVVQPDIATWGEYIRWVGAAAASVVVWEWVERIEALERDERKDGILGREVFDGDEMLGDTPSEDVNYGGGVRFGAHRSTANNTKRPMWKDIRDLNLRPRLPQINLRKRGGRGKKKMMVSNDNEMVGGIAIDDLTRPLPVATPISRADTTSASTIYAVRYHNPLSPSPIVPEEPSAPQQSQAEALKENSDESTLTNNTSHEDQSSSKRTSRTDFGRGMSSGRQVWQGVSNPFKRKRTEPPAEVAAQIASSNMRRSPGIRSIKNRLNIFNSNSKGRVHGRNEPPMGSPQVTVIPAQPRGSRRGSRVDQQGDAPEHNANLGGSHALNSVIPEVDEDTNSQTDQPVTVIPAPVRGGRTWSPDDLYDPPATSTTSPASTPQPRLTTPAIEPPRPILPTRKSTNSTPPIPTHANRSNTSIMQTQNTPGRSSSSPGSHAQLRSSGRERNVTMTSISDRLSVSPGATPGISTTPVSTSRAAAVGDPASRPTGATPLREPTPSTGTTPQAADRSTPQPATHSRSGADNSAGPGHVTFTQASDKSIPGDSRIDPRPP